MAPPAKPPNRRKRAATMSSSQKKKGKQSKTTKSADPYNDVSRLLGPSDSIIYNSEVVNIQQILRHPRALEVLHPTERAMLSERLTTENASRVVAEFREDGYNSRHNPEWQGAAQDASGNRNDGEYNSFSNDKFKKSWAEADAYVSDDEDEATDDEPTSIDRVPGFRKQDKDDDFGDGGNASAFGASNQKHPSNLPNAACGESNDNSERANEAGHNQSQQGRDFDNRVLAFFDSHVLASFESTPLPRRELICAILSNVKLTDLVNVGEIPIGLKVGDIIRYQHKDAVVASTSAGASTFTFRVPPGQHRRSEPDLRADITYPNASFTKPIRGPSDIANAMQEQDTSITESANWKDFKLVREGVVVGNLHEFRQAWQFAVNEYQYRQQLLFLPGRRRRVSKRQQNEGFQCIDNVALYRKIEASDFPNFNQNLIIDLGPYLTPLLDKIAQPGYKIIMVDYRIMNNDGIPMSDECTLEEVYHFGPMTFSTGFLRDLAGSYGWSKGHAHIGPLGLGKGYHKLHWGYSRAPGGSNISGPAALSKRPSNEFFNLHNKDLVGTDLDPKGFEWTQREKEAVLQFQRTGVQGAIKLKHHPIPRAFNCPWPELQEKPFYSRIKDDDQKLSNQNTADFTAPLVSNFQRKNFPGGDYYPELPFPPVVGPYFYDDSSPPTNSPQEGIARTAESPPPDLSDASRVPSYPMAAGDRIPLNPPFYLFDEDKPKALTESLGPEPSVPEPSVTTPVGFDVSMIDPALLDPALNIGPMFESKLGLNPADLIPPCATGTLAPDAFLYHPNQPSMSTAQTQDGDMEMVDAPIPADYGSNASLFGEGYSGPWMHGALMNEEALSPAEPQPSSSTFDSSQGASPAVEEDSSSSLYDLEPGYKPNRS